MKRGTFIVIDGPDGAGKGTMVARVKELLGDDVITTREPGGSPYAEEIRTIALKSKNAEQADGLTIFLLMWAARADHIKNIIRPALENGKIVVCDRFDSSTYAYNIIAQKAIRLKDLFWQLRECALGDLNPDLYIYLSVESVRGVSRKKGQGKEELNHLDDRGVQFQNAMREGFEEFFHKLKIMRFGNSVTIDANRPEEEVWKDLSDIIKEFIRKENR